jgi:glutamine synthetase
VFLGETLSEVTDRLIKGGQGQITERMREINLDLARVPVIARDNTDRNRTSPFAFTGNKFEFRAVGASASISPPLTYLNAATSQALKEMNHKLRANAGNSPRTEDVLAVIVETFRDVKRVCFEGNGYSTEWHSEAERRGLPNLRTTPDALKVLRDPKIQTALANLGIHTKDEADARFNVQIERYIKVRMIELETLLELVSNDVYPAALSYLATQAQAAANLKDLLGQIPSEMDRDFKRVVTLTTQLSAAKTKLGTFIDECGKLHDEVVLADKVAQDAVKLMNETRYICDELELLVDDKIWSLPKYRELLYSY